MPETIAAPPATPAAVPAPVPTPAPSSTPPPPPPPQKEEKVQNALQGSFDELDGLASGKAPPEKKEDDKADEDESTEAEKPAQPENSDLEAAAKPKPQQQGQPKVASLRHAYEKTKGEVETLRKELQAREAALAKTQKDFEEFKAKPSAILPEVENLKKRNTELEDAIRFADYKRSKDYEEKYQKPIQQAYAAALEDIGQMQIEGEDRKATDKDFYELLQMNAGDAARRASELFGAASPIALQHRTNVLRSSNMRAKAEAEFKALAKQREEQAASRAETVYSTYKTTIDDMSGKFPELFKFDPEKDKDLAEAFDNGAKLADTAFMGFADGANDPDSHVRMAKVQGAVRMRAAALVPALLKLRKAEEEIKGLKEKLQTYEKSEPAGATPSRGAPDDGKNWEQEIEALAGGKR